MLQLQNPQSSPALVSIFYYQLIWISHIDVFQVISTVSICRIIVPSTVRSTDHWQGMYFGVWEAEVALSVCPGVRCTLCALSQHYDIPLQFFAFPATGDSTCRAFLREIPSFISKLRLVSCSVSVAQLCPGAFIWVCIIPQFLWTCLPHPVSLECHWNDTCRVCVS